MGTRSSVMAGDTYNLNSQLQVQASNGRRDLWDFGSYPEGKDDGLFFEKIFRPRRRSPPLLKKVRVTAAPFLLACVSLDLFHGHSCNRTLSYLLVFPWICFMELLVTAHIARHP